MMKIKTYKAGSMPLALAQVKKDLGSDAVIVHTRTVKKGGVFGLGSKSVVEITARKAGNNPPARKRPANRLADLYAGKVNTDTFPKVNIRANPSVQNNSRLSIPIPSVERPVDDGVKKEISQLREIVESLVREQRQLHAPQMPEQLFDMYLDLVQREVADEIARELIDHVQRDMTGDQIQSVDLVRNKLVNIMDNMISTAGPVCPNLNGNARVVVLIGPTGVGKTTSIAKIAANLKLRQNKKVGLITIDTYRIGAVDQLRMYSQIIDVPLKVVLTPGELRGAIDSMNDYDFVLVDTAGRSQKDDLKLQELKTFIDAAKADEVHLVLSSTANQSHMLSAAERFKSIGVDRIILTKLDEAISFGVILSVMKKVDASISYVTTGQAVPDDIEVAGGQKLARMMLGLNDNVPKKSSGYVG
ncbi:MAG: flagellar biosynthesis protein FlhF [Phycisphaerae bacterium]|nr:flagellar biosynthesis protein FlhF [Phycisphaerae bacterium]